MADASPCEQASAYREARLLIPARDACVELIGDESAAPCAPCADLATLAEEIGTARGHLARGETLAAAGEAEPARQAFVEALRIDASLSEARKALEGLAAGDESETQPPAAVGASKELEQLRDLVKVGAVDTAKTQLSELIGKHPDLAEKTLEEAELKHLADGRLPWWRDFLHWIAPWARFVVEALALVLVVLAALRALPPLRSLRRWLMRRLLRPAVRIEELKTSAPAAEIGAGFAALLGSGLSQPPGVDSAPYTMVTTSIEGGDVPEEITTAVPGPLSFVKALPALMSWLSLRREIVIGGTLYQGGQRGAAATITVSEADQILETKTFWERDLAVAPVRKREDDLSVFYHLAERVGVWLMFALERAKSGKALEVMGTSDWESFALFRAGLRVEGVLRD